MGLPRGFKADANAISVTLRRELRLEPHAPICPWKLAEHLAIPVIRLSEVRPHEPDGVGHLLRNGKKHFSAVTIFVGRHRRRRLIFHNDGHALPRQRANITHELAHAIRCHTATELFNSDSDAEEEANWLGPAILVPAEAALMIAEQQTPTADAAQMYGVSRALLLMRLNVTGARIRVARRSRASR